jgi:TetR/AcrR family transcriptional regulator
VAENPIRALWAFSSDPKGAALILELWVLGNHRKPFRRHIAQYMTRLRKRQVKHLARFFEGRTPEPEALALLVANLVVGVSRPLVGETAIGMGEGHGEILSLFEAYAGRFDPPG